MREEGEVELVFQHVEDSLCLLLEPVHAVAEVLLDRCALRHNAERLFDAAEALDSEEIRIDFSGCDSLTRSFAQEYARRKAASAKRVHEVNLSEEARRMLEIVRRPRKKERFDFSRWKEEAFPSC